MTGYVGVGEQVDKDFHRALLKASLHRWKDRLLRDSDHEHLRSFEEAKSALMRWSQAYRGMRTVEVDKIAGSVGRYKDFDRSFLPRKMSMGERWSRVDSAYHEGVELPAVSLYKVGDEYYVRDGNHRVSVARYHKVVTIDAEVVELRGYKRKAAAHGATHEAGPPLELPRQPPEPGESWLLKLWQHLRPGPRRPDLRPLTRTWSSERAGGGNSDARPTAKTVLL
jgi:hypothetical protein